MANLSIEQMVQVQNALTDAYEHVFPQFIGDDKIALTNFLAQLANNTSFYSAFTSDGISQLSDMVFGTVVTREFVLRTTNAFLARFGDAHSKYDSLVETLAWSYSLVDVSDKANAGYNAMPEQVATRLPNLTQIRHLLFSNKWLVTLSLLSLYTRVQLPKNPLADVK